ncbi:MAG: response regulator [Eubacteriales bacterium]|nr:response regulator [Eubacteriales bacterium]
MYKIVIADDERMICEGLLSLDWESNGMKVVGVAKNGVEAEEIIDSQIFDVLLTDIKMPGIGGLELVQYLKEANPATKVILLSGYGEFEYAQKAISLGVYGYILKPSTPKEIMEYVKSACEKIHMEQEKKNSIQELKNRLDDYEGVIGARQAVENQEKGTDIQDILQYIYAHHAENLTLSALAGQFYFSTVYMSCYIKKYTGHTFLEILTSVRMYHGAKLLKETKMKNREIGMRIGIPDERYFGQVFKKTYGVTPYEYRKSNMEPKESLEEFLRSIIEEKR